VAPASSFAARKSGFIMQGSVDSVCTRYQFSLSSKIEVPQIKYSESFWAGLSK